MFRLILSLILPLVFLFSKNYGQATDPAQILKDYFERAANGHAIAITAKQISEIPFHYVMEISVPFLKDQNPRLRYRAIDIIKRAGSMSWNEAERKTAVTMLTEACKDPDGGNSGVASSGLTLFKRNDFTQQVSDTIAELLGRRCYHFERMIRIAGFLENPSTVRILDNLKPNDSTLSAREAWAVELALARAGKSKSLDYCLQKISSEPVNDNSVTWLFPDLVYIRRPESINYILNEILSDEKKCISSNPDREEKIICAFKLIELVAPVVEDFPVKLTRYGEIDTDNYDETLLHVREWIQQNPSPKLIRNTF